MCIDHLKMATSKWELINILFFLTSPCISTSLKAEYSDNTSGSRRFGGSISNSGNSGGFGGNVPRGGGGNGGGGMGVNPFQTMTSGTGANTGGSPFTASTGNGDSTDSSGMGPFASGGNGNGASPFPSANSNGGGSNGKGAGPFSGAMSGKGSSPFKANMDVGSSPFKANMDGGGMAGSSLLGSGPGGLAGGDFFPKNVSMLMGHDYSKDTQFGGDASGGVDSSRFDTSAYQKMFQQLFNTDNSEGLKDLGTPFDGSSYNYNSNTGDQYNTAVDSSKGSFASTDMTAYSGNSGSTDGQSGYQGIQKGNSAQHQDGGSNSYSGGGHNTAPSRDNSISSGSYTSPFNVNNYGPGPFSSNSHKQSGMSSMSSGMGNGQGPFNINNYNTGKSPFSTNSNGPGSNFGNGAGSGTGSGAGPFDTSNFGGMSSKQSEIGQNPFDTSKYQDAGSNSMLGNQQYQNTGTGSVDYQSGLDEYGNVNFGSLSELSGNPVDAGRLGSQSYSSGKNSYSSSSQGSSSYNGYQDGTGLGQYGNHDDFSYRTSGLNNNGGRSNYNDVGYNAGSESQYETPFESDNYNDLLENPFKSDSYFDSTRQNFKEPYETDNMQQPSYSGTGQPAGYGGSAYGSGGTGPAGDPFNQGGNSMRASNSIHGR